jgi:fucose 4-O-acetylase-like acetyltransferase
MIYWSRKYLTRMVLVEPLVTLGKASLEVFCAHVFFVFVGLALLYGEVTELHGPYALILLIITFTALILVAIREVRRKQKARVAAHAGASISVLRQDAGDPFRPAESRAEV